MPIVENIAENVKGMLRSGESFVSSTKMVKENLFNKMY